MLVLASQSPRRQEILSFFKVPFEVRPSDFDEESLPFDGSPDIFARQLASEKTKAVETFPGEVVLAADTVVYSEGELFGKPASAEEAFEVLKKLSGSWHTVYTGVAVRTEENLFEDVEATRVLFNSPTDAQLSRYHDALACGDKAGGYAIQEAGSLIVKSIEGCYYNVMGLPINTTQTLLAQAGIDLWDYIG